MTFLLLILLLSIARPASAEDSAVIPIADPVAALDRILAAQAENKARLTSAHVFWEIRRPHYSDQGNKKGEELIEVELGFIGDQIGMRWKIEDFSLDGKNPEAKPEVGIYSAYDGNDFRVLIIENGRESLRIEDERDSQTNAVLPFREFRIRPELERLRAKFSDGKPSHDLIGMRTIEGEPRLVIERSGPGEDTLTIYVFDPTKAYSLIRKESRHEHSGSLRDSEEYSLSEVSPGAWVPLKIQTTDFDHRTGTTTSVHTVTADLSRSSFNRPNLVPEDIFTVPPLRNGSLFDSRKGIDRLFDIRTSLSAAEILAELESDPTSTSETSYSIASSPPSPQTTSINPASPNSNQTETNPKISRLSTIFVALLTVLFSFFAFRFVNRRS